MTDQTSERISTYISVSDLPRKERKLDWLRAAYRKRLPLALVGDIILLDGIAIDPSELENGYWL